MNLPVFLSKVDALASRLSHDSLLGFIHEIARTLPENKRDYFLELLENFKTQEISQEISQEIPQERSQEMPQKIVKDDGYNALRMEIEVIKEKLAEIDAGDRCLDSVYNEEWDDWYNSDVDEILFHDPEGILDDIDKAIGLIHRCVDMEAYKEGCELAELLSTMEVSADGDYYDCNGSPLCLHELAGYSLLSYDLKEAAMECLYLTYMGNVLADRPDEIFRMMENFKYHDIRLEDIMQTGNNELPQLDEFLVQWVTYLGDQKSRHADRLLCEAQAMLQDERMQMENARKYAVVHPSLYKQFLTMKRDSGEDEKMLQVGMEALNQIPCPYVIRSEVALLTAGYACKLRDKAAVGACWLEAFRSDTTVINYMRIRLQMEDWANYKDKVKEIYDQVYQGTREKEKLGNSYYDIGRQMENSLSKNEYCFLLFLEEQFGKVMQIGMNEKNAVGWSATFMKQGLALFLLLLYNGKDLPAGLRTMLNMASCACSFEAKKYFQGMEVYEEASGNDMNDSGANGSSIKNSNANDSDTNNNDVFWELLCRWKRDVQVSDQQREKWLDKIDHWIEIRVEGIMNGNHRKYYGECAAYIAAFGEVLESLGTSLAKSHIMGNYKSKYSRRRAFHQELRNYGMW